MSFLSKEIIILQFIFFKESKTTGNDSDSSFAGIIKVRSFMIN